VAQVAYPPSEKVFQNNHKKAFKGVRRTLRPQIWEGKLGKKTTKGVSITKDVIRRKVVGGVNNRIRGGQGT